MIKNIFIAFIILFSCTYVTAQTPFAKSKMELFGDHLFIKLSVDGSEPLDFIFDTGDGLPVIDIDLAKKLNLDLHTKSAKSSAQGSITGALVKHNKIDMNGAHLEKDIEIYATSLKHLEISIGRNIDGIIGYDLLHHYAVRLDYDNMEFILYNKDSFIYTGDGKEFHFGLRSYIPTVKGSVVLNNGESLEGSFFLNTGAGTAVDFNTPFVNKNKMIAKTGEHYSYLTKGLGKEEVKHIEGRIKELKLGDFSYTNLPVGISQATSGIQHDSKTIGIIGNRLLSRYNLVFNYADKAIYFEERKLEDKEFHVNACGFELQMDEGMTKYLVHRIYEKGAGAEAGLKLNDELVEINGKPVSEMSLPVIKKKINKDGEKVKLTFKRGMENISVTLDLKELI